MFLTAAKAASAANAAATSEHTLQRGCSQSTLVERTQNFSRWKKFEKRAELEQINELNFLKMREQTNELSKKVELEKMRTKKNELEKKS